MQAEEAYKRMELAQLEVLSSIEREYQELIDLLDSNSFAQKVQSAHNLFHKVRVVHPASQEEQRITLLEQQIIQRADQIRKVFFHQNDPFGACFGASSPSTPRFAFGGPAPTTDRSFGFGVPAPTTGGTFGFGVPAPEPAPPVETELAEQPPQKKRKVTPVIKRP